MNLHSSGQAPLNKPFVYCLGLVLLYLTNINLHAQERILQMDVSIVVNKDRSVDVKEEIQVRAEGDQIKRGLKRMLPTTRYLKNRQSSMKYRDIRVFKDGSPSPYHTASEGKFKTLYIGDKNVFLEPGEYSYTIEYRVPNQVGMYDTHDEIYWNAIGTEWVFPIEASKVIIQIPEEAKIVQQSCYTGKYGIAERNCSFEQTSIKGEYIYELTRPLAPREGMTVAIGWEKGAINYPPFWKRYFAVILCGLGTLFLLGYYIITWMRYGIDPPKPTPYPIFKAPNDLSPAGLGYYHNKGQSLKNLGAAIVHLAIQGYLRIDESEEKGWFSSSRNYTLSRLKNSSSLEVKEEKRIMDDLFSGGDTVILDGKYDSHFKDTVETFNSSLKFQHQKMLNDGNNRHFLVLPILLSIAILATSMIVMSNAGLLDNIAMQNPNVLALALFFGFTVIGIVLYAYLIKQPSPAKQKLSSEIEGFKMYLNMAERDRMQLLNPPDRTPEHFEEMLPFAFALSVEHDWAELFKDVLAAAHYEPQWCNTHPVYFSNSFSNSFASTARTTSTPPQSSGGGSGGGGFSGGGGGGGGGGGW